MEEAHKVNSDMKMISKALKGKHQNGTSNGNLKLAEEILASKFNIIHFSGTAKKIKSGKIEKIEKKRQSKNRGDSSDSDKGQSPGMKVVLRTN